MTAAVEQLAPSNGLTWSDVPEDLVLPDQFFDRARARFAKGEQRLMLAVLEDAVRVYQKHMHSVVPKQKALFIEAEEWLLEEDCTWPFSFVNVCDALNFNPDYLRSGLKRFKMYRGPIIPIHRSRHYAGEKRRVVDTDRKK